MAGDKAPQVVGKLADGDGSALNIADRIQEAHLEDFPKMQDFVRHQIGNVLTAFYYLNGAVLLLILILSYLDTFFPRAKPVVTSGVLQVLVTASAGQLGVLAYAVGRRLLQLSPAASR